MNHISLCNVHIIKHHVQLIKTMNWVSLSSSQHRIRLLTKIRYSMPLPHSSSHNWSEFVTCLLLLLHISIRFLSQATLLIRHHTNPTVLPRYVDPSHVGHLQPIISSTPGLDGQGRLNGNFPDVQHFDHVLNIYRVISNTLNSCRVFSQNLVYHLIQKFGHSPVQNLFY
uniref:Uncharacterized protein n=1 Tax=Arundo donax TaxID=35708 RepID=A0A0A8Z1A0_ARUDO